MIRWLSRVVGLLQMIRWLCWVVGATMMIMEVVSGWGTTANDNGGSKGLGDYCK